MSTQHQESCGCAICDAQNNGATFEEARASLLAKITGDVSRVGWSFMGVIADGKKFPMWNFSYSIGLPKTLGMPDILIAGIGYEAAHGLVSNLFDKGQTGIRLEHGASLEDIAANGYLTRLYEIAEPYADEMLTLSRSFCEVQSVKWLPPLQLVYPDTQGRFPVVDQDYDWEHFPQPILWDVPTMYMPAGQRQL